MKYAAVVLAFVTRTGFVFPIHKVLNVFPVMHIVGWNPPTTDQWVVVPVDHIDEICICKELKDTGIVYIANFPTTLKMIEGYTGRVCPPVKQRSVNY